MIRSIRAAKLQENLVKINPERRVTRTETPGSWFLMPGAGSNCGTTKSRETLSSCPVNHARISLEQNTKTETQLIVRVSDQETQEAEKPD